MTPRTDTPTLIAALRILAADIQSGDGVANAAIAEAADRLEEMQSHTHCPRCSEELDHWLCGRCGILWRFVPDHEKATP